MTDAVINYAALIDEAMHAIVKKSLEMIDNGKVPGNHHFFISFATKYKGVELSEKLRKRYPEEMTIVLQYQFDDLKVADKYFSVILSFDGVKERVVVPFAALTAFADPSVKFGLQFRSLHEDFIDEEDYDDEEKLFDDGYVLNNNSKTPSKNSAKKSINNGEGSNVVALDKFRKK
jgi:hypothetical protein